jgi:rhodanese-related sulfurtransferase
MVQRIDARGARRHLESEGSLLVCAYDSEEKFEHAHLAGAISLADLESRVDDLSKDQEIIFYCQ